MDLPQNLEVGKAFAHVLPDRGQDLGALTSESSRGTQGAGEEGVEILVIRNRERYR
jgi:hypothetical protein